jgi:hypothetical protein
MPRESVALVDEVLAPWRGHLGADYDGYRNHVRRVLAYCSALSGEIALPEPVVVAAAFHDLGIWSDGTFDYLEPSASRAEAWLSATGRQDDIDQVQATIREHHKLRPCQGVHAAQAEPFRQADLVDVSLGLVRFGLSREFVADVRRELPDHGFHRRLVGLTSRQFLKRPWAPLPMVRW